MAFHRILYSEQAAEDLIDIWSYLDELNTNAANKIIEQIKCECVKLSNFPMLGQEREDIIKGIRHLPVFSYIVFYRIMDDYIEIIRVVHSARYLPEIL